MTILTAVLFALVQNDVPSLPPQDSRIAAYAAWLAEESRRDRARERLVHIGRPALEPLEKLDLDPAVLNSIRREIEFNESLGAAYGTPHRFSFDGAEEFSGVLLSRLETTSGLVLQRNSVDLSQKLSVRADDVGTWEALDEICRLMKLRYSVESDPIYLMTGPADAKPRNYYGSLILLLDRVTRNRRITFDTSESELSLRLVGYWDRAISPLGWTGQYRLSRVVDSTGSNLIASETPVVPPAKPLPSLRMGGQAVVLGGLRIPAPEATHLATVEGTLDLEFPASLEEIRFNTSEPLPLRRETSSVVVELKSLQRLNSWAGMAEIVIRFPSAEEAAAFRIGPAQLDFVAQGDAPRSGSSTTLKVEKDVVLLNAAWRSYLRNEIPKEIRIRIPRGSVIKKVPFAFKDVDLK